MPWCPECRLEYREGFKRCNDCDVELVDELEPEQLEKAEGLLNEQEVYFTTVKNEMEAGMIKTLLKQNGIASRLKYKEAGSTITGTTYLGLDIYVLSNDYDFAKEIIENKPVEQISEEELESQALQYEPEPDVIDDEDGEEEDDEGYEEPEEEEVREPVQEFYPQDDREGIKSTYIGLRWIIIFAFLAFAAVYLITRTLK